MIITDQVTARIEPVTAPTIIINDGAPGGPGTSGIDPSAFASRIDPATIPTTANCHIPDWCQQEPCELLRCEACAIEHAEKMGRTIEMIGKALEASRLKPTPIPTESLASLAGRLWMAETTALLITNRTIEDAEWYEGAEGRSFDPDQVVEQLEPDNQAFFASYLRMFGGSATNWRDWLDLCWAGSPVIFPPWGKSGPSSDPNYPEVEPTPDVTEISPEAHAEHLGHTLGSEGLSANPPTGMSCSEQDAFRRGFRAGQESYEARCLEELANDPEFQRFGPDVEYSELVEHCGVEFARNYNPPE